MSLPQDEEGTHVCCLHWSPLTRLHQGWGVGRGAWVAQPAVWRPAVSTAMSTWCLWLDGLDGLVSAWTSGI